MQSSHNRPVSWIICWEWVTVPADRRVPQGYSEVCEFPCSRCQKQLCNTDQQPTCFRLTAPNPLFSRFLSLLNSPSALCLFSFSWLHSLSVYHVFKDYTEVVFNSFDLISCLGLNDCWCYKEERWFHRVLTGFQHLSVNTQRQTAMWWHDGQSGSVWCWMHFTGAGWWPGWTGLTCCWQTRCLSRLVRTKTYDTIMHLIMFVKSVTFW